jgi:16S rRNA processing protein RimM
VGDRPKPSELVLLGTVSGVRGLRGEVRIKSYTADPADIAAYGPLWDAAAGTPYRVRVVSQVKGQVVARIDGIHDRTAAERLQGLDLHAPRAALPGLVDADEFYHIDLIGLEVVDTSGVVLGRVGAVNNFGAGDVLEIVGGPGENLVLPFTRTVVPHIDLPARRVTVSPPPEFSQQGGTEPKS